MRDPETRRGVPLRAGVSLVAVAATVAATFALAGPASAATSDLVTLSPTAPTTSAQIPVAFSGTAKTSGGAAVASTPMTVTVSQPNPSAAAAANNPLSLGAVSAESTGGGGANPWTDTGTVTTDASGNFTFTVTSKQPGAVTINATETADVSAPGAGENPTSTLTVSQPTSIAQTPGSATSFTDGTGANTSLQKFTATATNANSTLADMAPVHIQLTQTTPTGTTVPGSDPFVLEDSAGNDLTGNAGYSSAASGQTWTATYDSVYTAADGTAAFQVGSTQTGTVTVRSAADDGSGAANNSVRATSTLTVASYATGNAAVKSLTVTPSTQTHYVGENATFSVQPLGADNQPVANAQVYYQVTSGPDQGAITAGATTDGQGTAVDVTVPGANAGTDSVVFWVNNASTGTSGIDAGEPTANAAATFKAAPAPTDTYSITTPSDTATPANQLLAGQTTNVPFTVTVKDGSATPAPVSGVTVLFHPSGTASTGLTDQTATTDANGQATVTFTVPKANATAGNVLQVDVEPTTVWSAGATKDHDSVTFAAAIISLHPASTTTQAVNGGTVSLPVTVSDQFGNPAGSGDSLSYVISGRNAAQSSAITGAKVTVDSNGKATVTYPDKGTTGSDTVTISDSTHSAYGVSTYTVDFVASVTPGSLTVTEQPTGTAASAAAGQTANGTLVGTGAVDVDKTANYAVTFELKNSDGTALIGQPVAVTVNQGFVGTDASTDSTAGKTVTATTDPSGLATVYVGSTQSGAQTITASAGSVTATADSINYAPLTASTLTLTGPSKNVQAGGTATFVAKVADEFGNGIPGENVYFTSSDNSVLPGAVSPVQATTGPDGTASLTITVPADSTSTGGTITATVPSYVIAAPNNTASAKYTVGSTVSKVKVAGITGVGVGGTEKIAVRVWNADGSLAGGATVNVTVTGANSATGTATTGANGELGWFSYTAKNAGTDHVTATIDGKTATTTVTISSAISSHLFHPVAQANGTFLYSVQTIPATAGARVNLFAVYHPGKADQALFHAGNSTTNAAGRAARATSPGYLVHGTFKHYRAGQTYVLVAKVAGSAGQSNMSSATAQ